MKGKLIEDPSLRNSPLVFRDRTEAGARLALALGDAVQGGELVLAIPAGGVPVAVELAQSHSLTLDLLVVRKLPIPGNPEAGFGALDPDGAMVLNEELLERLRLNDMEMREQVDRTMAVIRHREELFRHGKPFPDIKGKTVLLVDDGLASGFTMRAAVRFVRRRGPAGIIVAVPTGAQRTVNTLLEEVDLLACLNIRAGYPFAVAEAYRNWYDVSDREVGEIMERLGGS